MGKVTHKVELLSHTLLPEQTVALAAKLCYSKSDIATLKDKISAGDVEGFISRVMGMGHLSTIEHASFTFGIEGVSRALLAQITRHRIASFSVQSQRYVPAGIDFSYVVPKQIEALGEDAEKEYARQMDVISGFYQHWQKELGRNGESTNEDARFVLPQAAETKMIVTMNARELLHFFRLRCCDRAQWEIRAVAWDMLAKLVEVCPSVFGFSGPACVSGKCPEGAKSCGKMAEMKAKMQEIKKDK